MTKVGLSRNEENLFGIFRTLSNTTYVHLKSQNGIEWTDSDTVLWPKGIFFTRPKEETFEESVKNVVSRIAACTAPNLWITSPASQSTILDRVLIENGLIVSVECPAMLIHPSEIKKKDNIQPGLVISEVARLSSLNRWAQVVRNDAPNDDTTKSFARMFHDAQQAHPDTFRFFLGELGGHTVCSLMLYSSNGTAGIYWVATIPRFRKCGIGAAITMHAIREAFKSGCDCCVLHATNMGESVYLSLGFRELFKYKMYKLPVRK